MIRLMKYNVREKFMIYFKTDRLIFRDWKDTDLELFINMNADKEVMKYFPDTLTRDESEDFF